MNALAMGSAVVIEHSFDTLLSWVKSAKYAYCRARIRSRLAQATSTGTGQQLAVYSDPEFADLVSIWGEGTAWNEIQFLLASCEGRVLDMACGPGTILGRLAKFERCRVYGFDISAYLIAKAAASNPRLVVADATMIPFRSGAFDHSYSIGSLEHFTEDGIVQFLRESARITRRSSLHQIPTSRSGRDEGWLRLNQSYFNNSIDWWLHRFGSAYSRVQVLDSAWEDPISLGKWFFCENPE